MKNLFVALLLICSVGAASAQETGLVDIPAINPEYLKDSKYVAFSKHASQFSILQANFCGFLKLASTSTLGGYNITAIKMFDKQNNTSAGALQISPNSASGIGGTATRVLGGVTKAATSGLVDIGGASQTFYVDESELQTVIDKLKQMKELSTTTPSGYVTYTYVCQGGFKITAGYNITLKKPIWLGTVGTTAELPLGDFLDEIITMFTKGQEFLRNVKL